MQYVFDLLLLHWKPRGVRILFRKRLEHGPAIRCSQSLLSNEALDALTDDAKQDILDAESPCVESGDTLTSLEARIAALEKGE